LADAQVFGEGSEHHTLQPVLETIKERYKRLDINDDIYAAGAIVTADGTVNLSRQYHQG